MRQCQIHYQKLDFDIYFEGDQLRIYLDDFEPKLIIEGKISTLDNLPDFFNILDDAVTAWMLETSALIATVGINNQDDIGF